MAKTKAAESKVTAAAKKYMKPSEVATFGIGLFGVALLTHRRGSISYCRLRRCNL